MTRIKEKGHFCGACVICILNNFLKKDNITQVSNNDEVNKKEMNVIFLDLYITFYLCITTFILCWLVSTSFSCVAASVLKSCNYHQRWIKVRRVFLILQEKKNQRETKQEHLIGFKRVLCISAWYIKYELFYPQAKM